MKNPKAFLSVLLALLAAAGTLPAAGPQDAETKSVVPELWAFHEIIFPIWHKAYPGKDVQALRGYVPRINELAAKVYTASLPGILRDKKDKWQEGVAQLKKSVDAYNAAAEGTNDQALLAAAETLHAMFEGLARIIVPVIPEVDAFHQVLYVIYHKFLPDTDFASIRDAVPDLLVRAEAVVKAPLPPQMSAKKEAYERAAAALLQAVRTLAAVELTCDIPAAIETVHTSYQTLEKTFEGVHIKI